jgi:hypothetical protein
MRTAMRIRIRFASTPGGFLFPGRSREDGSIIGDRSNWDCTVLGAGKPPPQISRETWGRGTNIRRCFVCPSSSPTGDRSNLGFPRFSEVWSRYASTKTSGHETRQMSRAQRPIAEPQVRPCGGRAAFPGAQPCLPFGRDTCRVLGLVAAQRRQATK